MLKQAKIVVSGRVQGVFYRACTQEKAKQLGLSGWVKNLLDSRVEICCQGSESQIDKLVEWCWTGSPASHVAEVEFTWQKIDSEFSDFTITY